MKAGEAVDDMGTIDSESIAWKLLLAVRSFADSDWIAGDHSADEHRGQAVGFYYEESTDRVDISRGLHAKAQLVLDEAECWQYAPSLSAAVTDLLDLYLPVLGTPTHLSTVVGHLGQSLDSRVATRQGDAFFVTGEENRKHLHRMRALCHAVIVGVGTVVSDDPQLTTRDVTGENPVRVVIDPNCRVPDSLGIVNDGASPTWLLHQQGRIDERRPDKPHVQRIALPARNGEISCRAIIEALVQRGLTRLFVEGGGVTVSRFYNAGCLHGLQLAVAPILVGDGRSAMDLPGVMSMQAAHRAPHKLYRMGGDIMWDFDLRETDISRVETAAAEPVASTGQVTAIERLL